MLTRLATVLAGESGAFIFRFVRTMLLARLTTVEDFGVAALFSLVLTAIESLSMLGLRDLLVQSERGDDPRFQAGLQGIYALRGLLMGLLLFFSADLFAGFFRQPEIAPAFAVLALAPVLGGFIHFDVYRVLRSRRHGPLSLATAAPAAASALAIWPFFLWLGDYRAMIAAILLEKAIRLAISHAMATRSYTLAFAPDVARDGFRFGWPLMLNAMMIFFVMQGEKIIVGRELGPVALGLFAMGLTISLSPCLLLGRTIRELMFPVLSRAKSDEERFRVAAAATVEANLMAGVVMAAGLMALGPLFLHLAFGEKFRALAPLLPLFALVNLVRLSKSGPALVAMARGRTSNVLVGNVSRLLVFPVMWWAVLEGYGLDVVLWIAIGAECLGASAAFLAMRRRAGFGLRPVAPALFGGLLIVLAVGAAALGLAPWPVDGGAPDFALVAVWLLGPAALGLAAAPALRRRGLGMLRR